MQSSLDTKKVWEALMADPAFTNGGPPDALVMFREVVDALPKVLDGQLEDKVSFSTLMRAKLAIIEHMLETGFVDRLVPKILESVPEDQRPDADEMVESLKDAFAQLRMPLTEMARDVQAFLAQTGLTERNALASQQGGLNAASLKAYDAGTLTVGGLLETQPAVLLANGG